MPGKVKSLFGPRPILTIGLVFTEVNSAQGAVTWLQATEKRSVHRVDIVAVESLGRLLRRALRLSAVIVLSGSLRDSC